MTTLAPEAVTLSEGWAHLRSTGEALWATQEARIALANRMAAMEKTHGASTDIIQPAVTALSATEKALTQDLVLTMREVIPPTVLEWITASRGIGEVTIARLLATVGHPRYATPMHYEVVKGNRVLVAGEPYVRTVSQFWQYCGVGDPNLKPARGMSQDELLRLGKPRAKALVYVISDAALKGSRGDGRYRAIYDDSRDRYKDRCHERDCPQCRAKAGEPWRPGHQHAAALRKVGKEILKDLWIAAR